MFYISSSNQLTPLILVVTPSCVLAHLTEVKETCAAAAGMERVLEEERRKKGNGKYEEDVGSHVSRLALFSHSEVFP